MSPAVGVPRRVLVIGATSAIARAWARLAAARGERLYLLGRAAPRLAQVAADLQVRGAGAVRCAVSDATEYDTHPAGIEQAWDTWGGFDVALVAHGVLPDQRACEASFALARRTFEVNALGVISYATALAPRFERQRTGSLAVISSVAADRGRRTNYVYGAGKAAVDVFVQGLRARLHPAGIHVLTVKPGFVDTPMTAAFTKGRLWATPERIAEGIDRAVRRRREVVYLPWFWRPVMGVLCAVPEVVFKRARF